LYFIYIGILSIRVICW